LYWNGDSRGHWEGNTLVVDTTNYNGKGWIGTSAQDVISAKLNGQRVTETVGNDHPRSVGHSPKPARGGPYLERVVEKVGAKVIP